MENKKVCNLCLYYSSKKHAKIINKDYDSIHEIDLITRRFKDENDFRNDRNNKAKIAECQNSFLNYLEKVPKSKQDGKIYILKGEEYIKPYYKSTYRTPKQLIESITNKLREEQDNHLLLLYLRRFGSVFDTDAAKVRGFKKLKDKISGYGTNKVESSLNKTHYEQMLSVINELLMFKYKKQTRSISEKDFMLIRRMSDYIDEGIENRIKLEQEQKNRKIQEKPAPKEEYVDPQISFDDLGKIMDKMKQEELERNAVKMKDFPELISEYKKEIEELDKIIKIENERRELEEIRKILGDKYYLNEEGQVEFSKARENRDREELPDEEENKGLRLR